MSSLVVAGDTSGSVTISAPAVSGSSVLTLPAVTDTLVGLAATQTLTNKSIVATQLTGTVAAARLPAGGVLQVVQAVKTDTQTTTSDTFGDITSLSASITPGDVANKILVLYSVQLAVNLNTHGEIRLMRGATAIGIGAAAGSRTQSTAAIYVSTTDVYATAAGQFLDAPATTSSTTYKVQVRANTSGQSVHINRTNADTDAASYFRAISTITLMEIKV